MSTNGSAVRIVIAGGGYAGLGTALHLNRQMGRSGLIKITLIDLNDKHEQVTRIHEAAAGRVHHGEVYIPFSRLLRGKNIEFKQAKITGFDFEKKVVKTDKGEVPYDKLVVAMGSTTNFFGIPGLQENSFELKTVEDARRIRRHINEMFKKAKETNDPEARKALLTFVVGGAGFTGVETAGELADWLPKLCKKYGISEDEVRLINIEAAPSILPGNPECLPEYTHKILEKMGVEVMTNAAAVGATPDYLELKDGIKIPTKTIIWTGGVRGHKIYEEAGLPVNRGGRIEVNEYSEVKGLKDVYAIGDASAHLDPATGRVVAPTAQYALQQADTLAHNLKVEITGKGHKEPHKPFNRGEACSIGYEEATAAMGKRKFTGVLAHLFKELIGMHYIFEIGGIPLVLEEIFGAGRRRERAVD